MGNYGRPPRVVALLENNPYPFDITVRPHAETLVVAGYQVTVICPRERDQPWCESLNGVQVYRFPSLESGTGVVNYLVEFVFATLMMTIMMLWVWLRYGLDVLHIYCPPDSLFAAALLPRLAGKTVIYSNRDLSPELYESKFGRTDSVLYRLLVWLERRASHMATHVLVVNESYRRIIMKRDGIPPDRISAVRIGPELDRVRLTAPDPSLRARARTIIAYLGQMAKQDGVDHLLRALHHLDQDFDHKDWFCVLIGRADEPQALEESAAQLGVSDRTWFTGYISDEQMVRYLTTADICVDPDPANPLNNISTMVKFMEYMALGKPVVAYDLTEHRVTAGDAALYAQPNDEIDMARQLVRLIEDPELRIRLGAMGRERVERDLAWKHQRERLLTLYNTLTQWGDASQASEDGA